MHTVSQKTRTFYLLNNFIKNLTESKADKDGVGGEKSDGKVRGGRKKQHTQFFDDALLTLSAGNIRSQTQAHNSQHRCKKNFSCFKHTFCQHFPTISHNILKHQRQ